MKKVVKTIFSLTLLGLFMFSCSSELVVGNADETPLDATPSPSSFLSVSIVASNATDTREADSDGTYRDGSEKENAVSSVLFLFYDKDGNPTSATKNGDKYYTYCYWGNEDNVDNGSITGDSLPDDMRGNHIEKALSERLINITIPHGKEKPAQLIVVLNPTENWEDWTTKNLNELEDVIQDFESGHIGEKEGDNFVMTNSVYVDEPTKTLFNAKILEDSHYKTTAEEALKNPVVVFVERVVARIDLTIDIKGTDNKNEENPIRLEDGSYIYYTGVSIPSELKEDGNDEDIYVKFLGWNVFSTPNQSRLIKKVNKDWSSQGLFGSTGDWVIPWTSTTFRRSFWAINPPLTTNDFKYNFGSFTNGKDADEGDFKNGSWTADHYPIADPEKEEYTTAYFQENASPAEDTPASDVIDVVYGNNYVPGAPVKPSKVIIAAQLVNKDGTPRSLAKWAGKTYTEDGLISSFASNLNMWKIKKEVTGDNGDTTTYTHITPEDLVFTPSQDEGQKYKVNLELNEEAQKVLWYTKNDEDVFELIEDDDIEAAIADLTGTNAVMVWKNGYTYFYFDIRHFGLAKSPGYYGVVRNHIYDARVRSISGLGTPVFDEFEDIDVVTQPKEDNWVIAAEVRILSWRVVRQDYDLKW